jgi:hypothetical protein
MAERTPTDVISEWIANDGHHYEAAFALARADGEMFERYLRSALRRAPVQSAAWHTRRSLSENELDSVEWTQVARELTDE